MSDPFREKQIGVASGIAAYTTWGVLPLYFRMYRDVPGVEILGHRVLWGVVLLVAILAARRQLTQIARLPGRTLALLVFSSLIIGSNWLLYIYAVTHELVGEASLGYYLTPLYSVILGIIFLGERLRVAQIAAVGLVAVGIAVIAFGEGLPLVALTLMATFGLYGLLRKTVAVEPMVGLLVETLVLLPFLGFYLISAEAGWFGLEGHFVSDSWQTTALLIVSGPVTIFPLLWFVMAARRLTLTTIGFLQYLAPTIQFGLAITVLGETFTQARYAGFVVIWVGILVFLTDLVLRRRRADVPAAPPIDPTLPDEPTGATMPGDFAVVPDEIDLDETEPDEFPVSGPQTTFEQPAGSVPPPLGGRTAPTVRPPASCPGR